MTVNVVDGNWPAAAFQDNVVGRMKQSGQFGGAGSGNIFGIPPMAAPVVALSDATINASGTVQNTIYQLNGIILPANSLNVTGRSYNAEFWGILAANANAKNFILTFGTFTVNLVTGTVVSGGSYYGGLNLITTG